jgi:eukaryotic-like serine/threonine-protein kinase
VARAAVGGLQALVVQKATDMLELELQPEANRALGQGVASPAALEFYLQARGYLQRFDRLENLEAALRVLERALDIDPSSAAVHAARAEAYLRVFQLSRAPEVLALAATSADRAMQLDDGLAPVQIARGMVAVARGDSRGAIESFENALRADPRNPDALRELANACEAAGRAPEAEAAYRRAIELRNGSWAAYKDLGVFYNRHGRLQEAAEALERVVALTPDSYSAHSNLGGIYLRLGRDAEAATMLRRSLALRPTAPAYTNLGSLEYFHGRFAEAAELFSRAVELSPKDERIWGTLGDSYRWVPGRESEALRPLRRALELSEAQLAVDGGNPQLRARRAIYLSGLGEHAQARAELDRALKAAPRDGFVLFRAALVHEQAGRREEARLALRAALQAGYSAAEIAHAPPLKALLREQEFTQLGAAREVK